MRGFVTISILLVLVTSINACAQDIHGSLTGRLFDAKEQPVEGANIILTGPSIQGIRGVASNQKGVFKIFAIPVGTYQLKIEHVSYSDLVIESVLIHLGKTTDLGQIVLESGETILDEVTIKWEDPIINQTTHTISGNLKNSFFESLPTSRDYLSTITLLPRVNESVYGDAPNISGGSGSDNMYWINGMNVRHPQNAASTTKLPFNFVKEIEVLQNGFQAEYGRSLGGIVNVITHSGSNDFKADIFGFITNDFLAGEPKEIPGVEKKISDFTKYDVGVGLSGPIVKDKLWYNIAYNYINTSKMVEISGYEPDRDQTSTHILAAKLNWNVWNNTIFDLSLIADPSFHNNFGDVFSPNFRQATIKNIDVAMSEQKEGSINISFSIKKQLNKNNFIEGVFYYSNWWDNLEGKTEVGKTEPFLYDLTDFSVSGGYGIRNEIMMRRFGVRLNNTTTIKEHQLKFGIEFESNYMDKYDALIDPGIIFKTGPQNYRVIPWVVDVSPENTIPVAFIQDSWRISKRIMLNYGLRWEGQYLKGPIDSVNISILDQFQPRVGIVVNPGDVGKNKLYSSYGRYYAQFPLLETYDKLCPYYNALELYDEDPRNPESEPYEIIEWATPDKPPGVYGSEKIKGEYADEFILGYDRVIKNDYLFSVKGIYRNTKNALCNGYDDDVMKVGNPGRGILDFLPKIGHKYNALELTFGKVKGERLTGFVSYVLSKTEGNYPGFYMQDEMSSQPGNYVGFQTREQAHNSYGFLPNDNRHNLKITANYTFEFGLIIGSYFNYITGAPYNDFGPSTFGAGRNTYLVQRGTAGRLPNRWDLNFRVLYDLKIKNIINRFYLDLYHVGNPREVTMVNQVHYLDYMKYSEGNPIKNEHGVPVPNTDSANPNYLDPSAFQSPMRIRLGLDIMFN